MMRRLPSIGKMGSLSELANNIGRGAISAAIVGRRNPDRRGAASGNARDGDPLRVDVGPRHQVVDAADAVPALDASRRVAERLPPPALAVVGAVVDAGDLAELECVDDQADVAV